MKIAIIRCKTPAQLLSSAHNKVHFPTLYPLSKEPLPGQAGTAWEHSKPEDFFRLLPSAQRPQTPPPPLSSTQGQSVSYFSHLLLCRYIKKVFLCIDSALSYSRHHDMQFLQQTATATSFWMGRSNWNSKFLYIQTCASYLSAEWITMTQYNLLNRKVIWKLLCPKMGQS
jgi:hypothetical protein